MRSTASGPGVTAAGADGSGLAPGDIASGRGRLGRGTGRSDIPRSAGGTSARSAGSEIVPGGALTSNVVSSGRRIRDVKARASANVKRRRLSLVPPVGRA